MHDPMQNHARGNIIFGDARLMAIIDLTQGCTPNHCYFYGIIVSRNVQWYMENYYFRFLYLFLL